MKRNLFLSPPTWLVLLCLCLPSIANAQRDAAGRVLTLVNGSHIAACTSTAVASTNANRAGPFGQDQLYLVYAYTSGTDFTGVGMKCIQGGAAVTVASQEGVKFSAGEKQIWLFQGSGLYISCQTGSGSGIYDVCLQQ